MGLTALQGRCVECAVLWGLIFAGGLCGTTITPTPGAGSAALWSDSWVVLMWCPELV